MTRKRERPQNRNLRAKPENLGVTPLPAGVEITKPIRFTLPVELKVMLESMPKADRDRIMRAALQAEAEL